MTHLPPAPFSGPPFGDDTDEAVSALLDGELAGFAADHGIEESEARARLEAWSGLHARLEELRRASEAVAEVPDLDEHTRRRVVSAALAAGGADAPAPDREGRTPRRRLLRAGAAVAAAVLVAVVAVALVGRDGGSRSADSARSAAGGATTAPVGFLGDVGDVTDPAALHRLLGGQATPPAPAAPGAEGSATKTAPPAADRATTVEPTAAIARCASTVAGDAPVRFSATATSGGEPAYVIGITRDGRTIAFVVSAADCSIVGSVSR